MQSPTTKKKPPKTPTSSPSLVWQLSSAAFRVQVPSGCLLHHPPNKVPVLVVQVASTFQATGWRGKNEVDANIQQGER